MSVPVPDPEACAQIARLLGNESLRETTPPELRAAAERDFDALVEGLVAEIAASDDVFDRASALEFLDARVAFLGAVLDSQQCSRLSSAVRAKIEAW